MRTVTVNVDTIGEFLRVKRGMLSRKGLAERTGITSAAIGRFERDKDLPTQEELVKLTGVLEFFPEDWDVIRELLRVEDIDNGTALQEAIERIGELEAALATAVEEGL